MAKENPFQRAISSRKKQPELPSDITPIEEPPTQAPEPLPEPNKEPAYEVAGTKKRGRPATGKRSDDKWIGRTFYIQKETDFDVEAELLDIKRQGIDLDKSELVERLLAAWVKWRNGKNSEIQLLEISPRRKDD
jgi:hypothetical protein